MVKRDDRNLLVGLDIGTSKVVAIVAEVSPEGEIEVIGIGSSASRGLKRGVVVNIESTVQSIQRAVEEAELMAGCEINTVYTGIAGSHVKSINSHGIVAIRDKEVTAADVERVIDAARAVAIPADQRVLHVLPQEFIIDSQEGIPEPIGMSGVRLEAKVHLVTGAVSAAQNIVKCVQRCGLQVDLRVVEPAAFGAALLYFTGSKAHNIALRRLAQVRGLKISEYGVFAVDRRIAGDTEESVYRAVGLPLIPPELREDRGELDAAARGELPDLIAAGDLRGDEPHEGEHHE